MDGTLAFGIICFLLATCVLLGGANWLKTHGQHERHKDTQAMVTLMNGEVNDVSIHMKSMAASQKEIAQNLKTVHDDIKKTNMILDIKCREKKA